MMRLEGQNVILSRQEVLGSGIPKKTFESLVTRKQVGVARRGEYIYNTFPEPYATMLRQHHWGGLEYHEYAAVAERTSSTQVITGLEAGIVEVLEGGYAPFLPAYRDSAPTMEHARKLAQGAGVLDLICRWLKGQGAGPKKLALLDTAAALILKLEVPYLPTNGRRLQEKVKLCWEGAAADTVVKLPRQGNLNAAVHKADEEIEAWALVLRADGSNVSNNQIIRHIQKMCRLEGKKEPSEGWFKQLFARPETKSLTVDRYTAGSRHAAAYVPHLKIRRALHAGDCWQMDGTRMNMIPHKAGAVGKKVAGREYQYPYVVGCMDVHSGVFLGVHLDYTEDRWAYMSALKMAIEQAGYLPYELVLDRFPGHNTPEWQRVQATLEALGVKVTYAKSAQGKAQIERQFGVLQDVFLSQSAYAYGQGIRSSRANAHRNEAYINALTKKAKAAGDWDFVAAVAESGAVFELYHTTPINTYRKLLPVPESPMELHEQSEKPAVRLVDGRGMAELFGTERQAMLRSGYVTVQVDNEPVALRADNRGQYVAVPDAATLQRQYSGVSLRVVVAEDKTCGWVYDPATGRCLALLPRDGGVLVHGPQAEVGRLTVARNEQKALEEQRKAELKRLRDKVGDLTTVKALASPDEVALLRPRSVDKAIQEKAEDEETNRWGAFNPYQNDRQEGGILDED